MQTDSNELPQVAGDTDLSLCVAVDKTKLREFGMLGYSPEFIADILLLSGRQRQEVILRLNDPEDPYSAEYRYGAAVGRHNTQVIIADLAKDGDIEAAKMITERFEKQKIYELRKELFGV